MRSLLIPNKEESWIWDKTLFESYPNPRKKDFWDKLFQHSYPKLSGTAIWDKNARGKGIDTSSQLYYLRKIVFSDTTDYE